MLVHVGIKRGQRDPTQPHLLAVRLVLDDDVGARLLVFQFNFVAHQLDRLALRRVGRVRGNHHQPDMRAFFAANLLDHFVEAHVAHIVKFSRALRDRRDAIAHF